MSEKEYSKIENEGTSQEVRYFIGDNGIEYVDFYSPAVINAAERRRELHKTSHKKAIKRLRDASRLGGRDISLRMNY